jgi:hypothetical protein
MRVGVDKKRKSPLTCVVCFASLGPLADHSAVAVGDEIYILGGGDPNGTVLSQVLKYDPTLHVYTAMAPMPGPRYRFGATLLDSKKPS